MDLRRWWNRVAGVLPRALMHIMMRQLPHQEYDGVQLIVAPEWIVSRAEEFFHRTIQALEIAALGAPHAYAELQKDILHIVLWRQPVESPYHRFLVAALVSPKIALESDLLFYAAWLLRTSGLSRSKDQAQVRVEEFLGSLKPAERSRIVELLINV